VIVDAGNVLFPNEKMDKSQESFQKARAELLMKGNRLMNVVAQNVGYLDLTAGVDFLKKEAEKNKLRLISANWVDKKGNLLFEPMITYDLGREKAVMIGLSRGFKNADKKTNGEITVLDPIATLEQRLANISAENPVIVLSDLGTETDKEIANKMNRPLIIVGARDLSSLEIPMHEGQSILVQGQLQGQQWGVLEVGWRPEAKAWYNIGVGVHFSELWKKNAETVTALMNREASDEGTQEAKNLESAYVDMMRFAPGNLEKKEIYDYKLVDMGAEYLKANELTLLMEKVKKIK
jgi:2',3'-cyclic-nucleotide 2'-phosphodiesterase (5'-nucleotidase family)